MLIQRVHNGDSVLFTKRQNNDIELMERKMDQFLQQHSFKDDEKKWLEKHEEDAMPAMLADFSRYLVEVGFEGKRERLSKQKVSGLESGVWKDAASVIRNRFRGFKSTSHHKKWLMQNSSYFCTTYNELANKCGGAKANISSPIPMFRVDAENLIEAADPTDDGIRMQALVAVAHEMATSINSL